MALSGGFGEVQEVEHKKSPGGDAEEVGHEDRERDAGQGGLLQSGDDQARAAGALLPAEEALDLDAVGLVPVLLPGRV